MNGANEYCELFGETQQIGKLYLVVSSHARGPTFYIYVLPEGEKAKPNGSYNPPLNSNAIEVYGIVSGQAGWTECYGWLHDGQWKKDFLKLVDERKEKAIRKKYIERINVDFKNKKEDERISRLLSEY